MSTKLSFHIPTQDQHIVDLIELISTVRGTTPSNWLLETVVRRLKADGIIDQAGKLIKAEYQTLQEALPPAAPRKKAPSVRRSSKNS